MNIYNEHKDIIWGIIGIFFIILIYSTFGTISAGERGVRTRFGNIINTNLPGLYIKFPFIEQMNIMVVQTQTISFDNKKGTGDETEKSSLFAASKDLQDVQIATIVNYHIDPTKVEEIYRQYASTENYNINVIEPIIRDTIKSISSQYTAEELVTKRAEFANKTQVVLTDRLIPKFVILERVNITNFQFSKSFNAAIEAKVTAEQNALAAKNKLEQVKFEAQQRVTQAEAEAKAIQIQAQAITQQGGAEYVNLKSVEKWNGTLPTYMMGNSVPFINLNK